MAESGTKTSIMVALIGGVATILATLISIYFTNRPQEPVAGKPATDTINTHYPAPGNDAGIKQGLNSPQKPSVKTTEPRITKQPVAAIYPDLKEIALDAKKITFIPKEYTYVYKQMELYGKWRTGAEQPWLGPTGNRELKLNGMNKWCVIIKETNKKDALSKEYKGIAIPLDSGATYALRMNEENGKYDDNGSNPRNPMRVLLRK